MRNNRKRFERIVSVQGNACEFGCANSEIFDRITLARKNNPNKGICVVRNWMILDCVYGDVPGAGSRISRNKKTSSLLYGGYVLFDLPQRFPDGRRILTSPLIALEPPAFFITLNTVYLLVGHGSRKKIKARTIGFS